MPGGIMSDRGAIVVIGSPASSSSWRKRYAWRIWYPSNGSSSSVIRASHFTLVIPYQPGTTSRSGNAVLRRKRHAVDLVRQERVAGEHLVEREAALVGLLLPALDAAVEPGEEHIARPSARRPPRAGPRRGPRQRAVPTASSSHGWLTTCGSTCARPLPAHSIVTAISTAGRARSRRATARPAARRARRPRAATWRGRPPGCRSG